MPRTLDSTLETVGQIPWPQLPIPFPFETGVAQGEAVGSVWEIQNFSTQ